MEQTLILKGIGVFATLLGVYQWMATEAQPTDITFILIVTVLLVLMDAERKDKRKAKAEAQAPAPVQNAQVSIQENTSVA